MAKHWDSFLSYCSKNITHSSSLSLLIFNAQKVETKLQYSSKK